MMKKTLALLLTGAMVVSLITGCASKTPAPTAAPVAPAVPAAPKPAVQPIKLQIGHCQGTTHEYTPLFKGMCDTIRKETNGLLDIADFPASQLGSEEEMCIAVGNGTLAMSVGSPDMLGKQYTPLITMHSPYIFKDLDHAKRVIASDLYKGWIDAAVQKTGCRILGTLYYGSRDMTSSKKVVTPADMKGLKLRIPTAPAQMAFAQAAGAVATPMAFAEVYLGLQQKAVDAQENPIPTIISQKFYEVQPYLMQTGHIQAFNIAFINEAKWKTLSADLQKNLKDNMTKTGSASFDIISKSTAEGIKFIQSKGTTQVIQIDKAAFQALGKPCIEILAKQYGSELLKIYDDIQKI